MVACFDAWLYHATIHIEDTVIHDMHSLQIMVSGLTAQDSLLDLNYVFVPTALGCGSILERMERKRVLLDLQKILLLVPVFKLLCSFSRKCKLLCIIGACVIISITPGTNNHHLHKVRVVMCVWLCAH